MFDHEKLDAYRLAIDPVAWVNALLDEHSTARRPSAARHLDAASAGKAILVRVVSTVTKLIEKLLNPSSTSTSTSTSTTTSLK